MASYERVAYAPTLVMLDPAQPLARWCEQQHVRDAIVGGFFVRPSYRPLGEVRIDGQLKRTVPFASPWHEVRACVQIAGGEIRIAKRNELEPHPPGDLLQAGPLLVRDGRPAVDDDDDDSEGFSAAAHQFDSDITQGRYPRAALAVSEERVIAIACDGRTRRDAGMTLSELANALVDLGALDAINLDGGGSASLVHEGRLRNRPREEHGADLIEGRSVVTALTFRES